jgi:5-(carboxyamino)imidazole ribonucleotide mutase
LALVGIVMGSDSDLNLMKDAIKMMEEFGVDYEVVISSAHRAPVQTVRYAETAEERGLEVIVAAAGAAAHLAGVIAASTVLPVIGVPVKSGALTGLDALYAIVQMPSGIPVATVNIDGAKNGAILAIEILGIKYPEYRKKMKEYKTKLAQEVETKNRRLQEQGWQNYGK